MSAFHYEIDDQGIAVVTFDLPGEKVNKLTTAVLEELDGLLDDLASKKGIAALIVRSGKPENFIAGADIAEIRGITEATRGTELSRQGQAVFRKLADLPFPTVAAIHGACLGGGLELALACDYRVISNDPKTGLGLPEVKIGILPGFGGTQRLPRLIGLANSLDLILTGKSVYPKKAKKIGLADDVAYKERLLDSARNLAAQARGKSKPGGVRAKRPLLIRILESNPLTRAFMYRQARANVLRETRGNYPAPLAALEAVRFGMRHGSRAGFEHEAQTLGNLAVTEVSKNLINAFYLGEALKKDGARSSIPVDLAGVIGAGIMGGGIAQLFSEKGISVRLKDLSPAAIGAGLRAAAETFSKRAKKGVLDRIQARDGMDRISGSVDYAGFSNAQIAIEAVVENMAAKKQVLREFEAVAGKGAIFASNTSSLSITGIAEASTHPERVVGMHFFNPVDKMPLVEVIKGKETSAEVVAAVAALSRRLGKLPVIVNDGPGFLVNRILMPYLGEAVRMLEEGGTIDGIDAALMQFGMPMGAFVLLDEIGIDVASKVAGILHEGLGNRVAPSELLATLYREGFHGRKNEKGFYLYQHGRRGGPNQAIYGKFRKPTIGAPLSAGEIAERPILLMIKEAALCMEDRIIDRPDLLDAALVFGIGFPPFRGGLLRYADSLGAKTVLEKLEGYARKYGDRFAPPKSLVEMSRDDLIGRIVR